MPDAITLSQPQWYVLHTLSGKESRVKQYIEKFKRIEELDDYIFEVLVPTEMVSETKQGKKSTINRKFYPGYVFIHAKLYDEQGKLLHKPWYFVKDTQGVINFVGGDNPVPLKGPEIEEIQNRVAAAEGKAVPKVQFNLGEEVRINDGPFLNLTGKIDEIDAEAGKLKVSVSIFGRFAPVVLEFWQVERVVAQ
jgi:transcriptional antiterminator NusG